MDSESACGDMIWPPSVWTMDYARDLPMAVGRAGLDVEEGRGTVTVKCQVMIIMRSRLPPLRAPQEYTRHRRSDSCCKPGYSQTFDPDHLGVPGAGRKGVTGRNMACPIVPMAPSKPCPTAPLTACRPWPTVWTLR